MKEVPNTVYDAIILGAKEEGIEIGIEQGIEKGKAEGKAEGIEETLAIINAIKKGTPVREIAKKMNVKVALVNKIKKQVKEIN